MATDYEILSQDFLYAVRVNDEHKEYISTLENVSPEELNISLNTENKKKAFWLNVYNAFIQIKAKEKPEWISEKRSKFFSEEWIIIAQKSISFDDIEHGILRKSNWKYGMGYIKTWFPSKYEKMFRMESVDSRIHFALNCGAAGCPPIAFYNSENLDEQLETATASFIALNSVYDEKENSLELSEIFSWFRGDFGGKKGIKALHKKHAVVTGDTNPNLTFKNYDWSLSLSNYVE